MLHRSLVAAGLAALLACSSASTSPPPSASSVTEPPPSAPPDAGAIAPSPSPDPDAGGDTPALDVRVSGAFARSAQHLPGGGLLVVHETPVHLHERWGRPLRALVWLDPAGATTRRREATAGRELLDAAVHPSGDVTILEAADDGYHLLRLDPRGALRGATRLVDDAILTDPPSITPAESRSPIERATHDAARLATDGEDVFLATRTGRHSVVAYRVAFEGASFAVRVRTLVVPAHHIEPTALNGGSYDTFNQLDAHYGVFVAVDRARVGWVAFNHARMEAGAMVKAHERVFGEKLVTDPDILDGFVARVAPSGERLGTSVVSTPGDEQLYGVRAAGEGVHVVGRSETWNAEGTGFDALLAHVDRDGRVAIRTLDLERGAIAFDVAIAPDGAPIVAGASGYTQNPAGASISEESHAFVRRLHADGSSTPLEVPDGPRHGEARFVLGGAASFIVGGMLDGPGTHSADGDATLLRSSGFVRRTR